MANDQRAITYQVLADLYRGHAEALERGDDQLEKLYNRLIWRLHTHLGLNSLWS